MKEFRGYLPAGLLLLLLLLIVGCGQALGMLLR